MQVNRIVIVDIFYHINLIQDKILLKIPQKYHKNNNQTNAKSIGTSPADHNKSIEKNLY